MGVSMWDHALAQPPTGPRRVPPAGKAGLPVGPRLSGCRGQGARVLGARVLGSPGTDPGLLLPLLRSSEAEPLSVGNRPLSGRSLPGGLGGTRMRRRKMHFFFLISLPQRNLGGSGGVGKKALESVREESEALKLLLLPPWTQS